MSYIKKHLELLKESYQLLTTDLDSRYFPTYLQIKRYEGLLGPDTLHSIKYVTGNWGYKKYNHMNANTFSGALVLSEKYYRKLVIKLKKEKGGEREAAWLAHFIADAIEPTHLVDWRVGKNQKKKLKKHFKLEKMTENVKASKKPKVIIIRKPLKDYLICQRKKINQLNLLESKNCELIISAYENVVIPLQIQAITSSWVKALEEAIPDE